ncbi:PadR family transcriptional regulator [Asticcacaulis sp. EMRT-3]|uniref:PadR family transcriptional regulator n=1 Tax=Asticcacaulis sp. EMRT-3 TaxID=3040349 RepID=UPI0024AF6FC5|nr:PadR family transcriptional regulator [Asticcacaulis sp. EMRT-3]MDI7774649.1 PadR family transcriptional regulator [Asticcacaulis sp. EMRT-3]
MRGFFFHRLGGGHGLERHFGHRDGFGRGFGRGHSDGFDPRRMDHDFRDGRGSRDGRGLGHGGLRLVLLKLIAEKPSHGYELIKAVEDLFKGAYTPSPGVVYPTLSWLEDEGHITIAAGEDGRKQASITDTGQSFLNEHADQIDAIFARMEQAGGEHGDYAPIYRAMHNLKSALRMRGLKSLDQTQIEAIVDLIDDTAKKIERL